METRAEGPEPWPAAAQGETAWCAKHRKIEGIVTVTEVAAHRHPLKKVRAPADTYCTVIFVCGAARNMVTTREQFERMRR